MAKTRFYIIGFLILCLALAYFIKFQYVITVKDKTDQTIVDYNDAKYTITAPVSMIKNKSYLITTQGLFPQVAQYEPIVFHRQKILVFMSDNRPLDKDFDTAGYNSLVAAINYEYCKKHNYDFVYYVPHLDESNSLYNCLDPKTNEPRHASWSKLLSTQRALDLPYDYVVYIDSDCIFYNDDVLLEDIILPRKDKSMLFFNDKPFSNHKPCAGFYICKTNSNSKQFIRDWYDVNMPNKNKDHAWEQSALHYLLYKEKHPFTNEIGIVDSWMFKEDSEQYLRHIGSFDKEVQRIPFFKEHSSKKKIQFETTRQIKTIYFNTRKAQLLARSA